MTEYSKTRLNMADEIRFRLEMAGSPWWKHFESKSGKPPNLDDEMYDYRGAWQAGIRPEMAPDGWYHWPSKTPQGKWLKSPKHPTAWMETYMQKTGIDPSEYGPNGQVDAIISALKKPASGLGLIGVNFRQPESYQ